MIFLLFFVLYQQMSFDGGTIIIVSTETYKKLHQDFDEEKKDVFLYGKDGVKKFLFRSFLKYIFSVEDGMLVTTRERMVKNIDTRIFGPFIENLA